MTTPESEQQQQQNIENGGIGGGGGVGGLSRKNSSGFNHKQKHVQFPDEIKCYNNTETSVTDDHNGNGHMIMIETLPEYSEEVFSWQEKTSKN